MINNRWQQIILTHITVSHRQIQPNKSYLPHINATKQCQAQLIPCYHSSLLIPTLYNDKDTPEKNAFHHTHITSRGS